MIPLRGRAEFVDLPRPLPHPVWLLENADTATAQRRGRAFLVEPDAPVLAGFDLYLTKDPEAEVPDGAIIGLPPLLEHLEAGDAVSIRDDGRQLRVLWRHDSDLNSILLTERCNHYCLMCSQPPKQGVDDWLLEDAFDLVRLLPRATRGIAFTGGEPTLHGQRLIDLLTLCRNLLPFAGVHVLSNGRRFADPEFAQAWAGIRNPRLMVGIPVYAAEATQHDYVVQAEGAFDETVRGLLQLGDRRQRIEVRVVIHKQTAPYLPDIAEFIARNLPFVEQVALMGLEMIGFARANVDDLWIDPVDYQEQLTEAVVRLSRRGIRTRIYNHQLCLLKEELWPYAVKSISDWKNEYHPECGSCAVADSCGGFFYSAKYRISENIKAVPKRDGRRARVILDLPG